MTIASGDTRNFCTESMNRSVFFFFFFLSTFSHTGTTYLLIFHVCAESGVEKIERKKKKEEK